MKQPFERSPAQLASHADTALPPPGWLETTDHHPGLRRRLWLQAGLAAACPAWALAAPSKTHLAKPASASAARTAASSSASSAPVSPSLPAEVRAALSRAQVPAQAMSAIVLALDSSLDSSLASSPPSSTSSLREASQRALNWQPQVAMNPASVMKLLSTQAALASLGPAWSWSTGLWTKAPVREGVLEGSLWLRASGDPSLVLERVWLLLRRLRQAGVREIRGDWLLDRSLFHLPGEPGPGDFDGDASRPYNVRPDALMLNYKALQYRFWPEPGSGQARVTTEPALQGVSAPASVPLSGNVGGGAGICEDARTSLRADWSDPNKPRFAGTWPAACGEGNWPVAFSEPESYNARLLARLWQELGGSLSGSIRDATAEDFRAAQWPFSSGALNGSSGPNVIDSAQLLPRSVPSAAVPKAPSGWRLLAEARSPSLAEVVRDINKFSNNLMAEMLFLGLPAANGVAAALPPWTANRQPTRELARQWLRQWLGRQLGEDALEGLVLDNGAGLSREQRIQPEALIRLLNLAWHSPTMPELIASLPVSGLDGTLRRSTVSPGRAHLKTGSLRDVAAVAGYVLSDSGRRWAVVGIINHPQASGARSALDALVQWTMRDGS